MRRHVFIALSVLALGCHGGEPATDAPFDTGNVGVRAELVPTPPAYWVVESAAATVNVGGSGVTAYRFSFDGAPMSDEIPIATRLSLANAQPGLRTVSVIGRNAEGDWQTAATTASFHMASGPSEPTACTLRAAGGTCDLIVDGAKAYYATSTTFLDTNNDGRPDYETVFDPTPGARICIRAGAHDQMAFRGFEGSSAAPLTFINCGGVATFTHSTSNAALGFIGSRYFRVVGTGAVATTRGIVITTSGNSDANGVEVSQGSSDFELAYLEISAAAYAGIVARTNVSCELHRATFAQSNTFIHHNVVHDTKGEGLYVGGSHWNEADLVAATPSRCGAAGTLMCNGTCVFEPELHGVRIYENRTDRTGAEGLQISSAFGDIDDSDRRIDWDTEIHDNVVSNADQVVGVYNSAGMAFEAGTTGRFYRNRVEGTAPTGAYGSMFIMGPGHIAVFNNVIVGGTEVGLVIQDNNAGAKNGPFTIVNNTIVATGMQGIYMFHAHSVGNVAYNNIVLGAATPMRLNSASIDWTQSNNIIQGSLSAMFVSAASGNYHLAVGSPAIGAGVNTSRYGVTSDIEGTSHLDGAYDVGAYAHAR
jgi:hypothetical protein